MSNEHKDTDVSSNTERDALIEDQHEQQEVIQTSTLFIIKEIWVWILAIFINFAVCLSVFPSVTALVESTEKGKVIEHWLQRTVLTDLHISNYTLLSVHLNLLFTISGIRLERQIFYACWMFPFIQHWGLYWQNTGFYH